MEVTEVSEINVSHVWTNPSECIHPLVIHYVGCDIFLMLKFPQYYSFFSENPYSELIEFTVFWRQALSDAVETKGTVYFRRDFTDYI